MQLSYIKDLSKAYVIDHRLFEGANIITEDELTENFYNAIKTIRSDHPNLYESFIDSNVYDQQRIFKMYFDLSFETYTEIDVDKLELEIEELEEGTSELIGGFLGTSLGSAIGLLATSIWKGLVAVGGLFLTKPVFIVGMIALLFPSVRKHASKIGIKAAFTLMKKIGNVGKRLSNVSDTMRIAYSIIQNNAQKCLQKCEYDPALRGRPSHYLYQMKQGSSLRDIGRALVSIDTEEKLDCLRTCYLENLRETTKLLATIYFQCLRNTGDISKLPLEKDFSAFQKIIVKTHLNETCDNFMAQFAEALDNFDIAVSMIYADEIDKRNKQRVDLMNDIYNLHKQSTDSRSSQSSQKPSYNNQKPPLYNNRRQ